MEKLARLTQTYIRARGGGGGRCLQGRCWFNHHCQYDVTLRASGFQDGGRSGNRRTIYKCGIFLAYIPSFTKVKNAETIGKITDSFLVFFW